MRFEATVNGRRLLGEVRAAGEGYRVRLGEREIDVQASETSPGFLDLLVDGASHEAGLWPIEGGYAVVLEGRLHEVRLGERAAAETAGRLVAAGPTRLTAPMPGRLVRVLVEAGQAVSEGQGLVVIEAMKMENELRSPRAGRVTEVHVRERQAVESGALLVVVEGA